MKTTLFAFSLLLISINHCYGQDYKFITSTRGTHDRGAIYYYNNERGRGYIFTGMIVSVQSTVRGRTSFTSADGIQGTIEENKLRIDARSLIENTNYSHVLIPKEPIKISTGVYSQRTTINLTPGYTFCVIRTTNPAQNNGTDYYQVKYILDNERNIPAIGYITRHDAENKCILVKIHDNFRFTNPNHQQNTPNTHSTNQYPNPCQHRFNTPQSLSFTFGFLTYTIEFSGREHNRDEFSISYSAGNNSVKKECRCEREQRINTFKITIAPENTGITDGYWLNRSTLEQDLEDNLRDIRCNITGLYEAGRVNRDIFKFNSVRRTMGRNDFFDVYIRLYKLYHSRLVEAGYSLDIVDRLTALLLQEAFDPHPTT